MSKKATEFQRKAMSWMYRGKEIFKPLNTGWIDENVACVREWVANIFFYRKGDTTIMVDAGYNYDRLAEKMGWLGIDPKSIHHILITHQDTDHGQITYWYGEEEKQARHSNICFIKQYFPRAQLHEIPKMDHAELVMMYPQDFYRRIMEFLTHTSAAQNKRS